MPNISKKRMRTLLKSLIKQTNNKKIVQFGHPSVTLIANSLLTNTLVASSEVSTQTLLIKGAASVTGDLTVTGKIKTDSIVDLAGCPIQDGFRMITGTIDTTDGSILDGNEFSVQKIEDAPGTVQVFFDQPFKPDTIPILVLSIINSNNPITTIGLPTNESTVITRISNGIFQFIAIGRTNS